MSLPSVRGSSGALPSDWRLRDQGTQSVEDPRLQADAMQRSRTFDFWSEQQALHWEDENEDIVEMRPLLEHAARLEESSGSLKALFFDFDGTLSQLEGKPEDDDAMASREIGHILRQLDQREDLKVFIVRGRDARTPTALQQQQSGLAKQFAEIVVVAANESMLQAAPSQALTVKVGHDETDARYQLVNLSQVRCFLRALLSLGTAAGTGLPNSGLGDFNREERPDVQNPEVPEDDVNTQESPAEPHEGANLEEKTPPQLQDRKGSEKNERRMKARLDELEARLELIEAEEAELLLTKEKEKARLKKEAMQEAKKEAAGNEEEDGYPGEGP